MQTYSFDQLVQSSLFPVTLNLRRITWQGPHRSQQDHQWLSVQTQLTLLWDHEDRHHPSGPAQVWGRLLMLNRRQQEHDYWTEYNYGCRLAAGPLDSPAFPQSHSRGLWIHHSGLDADRSLCHLLL